MAFHEVKPGAFVGKKAVHNRVAFFTDAESSARILISRDIYKNMGEPPFIRVSTGSGEHTGMLLLRGAAMKANTSAYKVSIIDGKGQATLTISANRLGIKKVGKTGTTTVNHTATDDGLVVDLRGSCYV